MRVSRVLKTRKSRPGAATFSMAGWLLSILALLQLSCPTFTPSVEAAPETSGSTAPEQVTLPNGLKVLLVEDHSFPVVSSMVWYRVGSRNETLGSTGVSHLVEHLLVRKVGNMRPGEVGALIARAGGQFNGYTSDDFTTFFEVLPPSRLEMALQIEAERMKSAVFTDKDVQDEVLNINREFETEGKDPIQSLGREIRAAAYQQHPYHNPTMGWQGDVEKLNAAHAKSFYERYFRPDNATLVIVGDIKAAAALALVKKHFGVIARPASKLSAVAITEAGQRGERRVTLKSSGKQEILEVAYHAPAIHEADAPALTVMEKLLNAPISGRLKSKLVEPRVCSSASAKFEAKKDPGLFQITCIAAAGNGEQKVQEGVDAVLTQLRNEPIADSELRRARNLAEFGYFSERDGPYRAAFHIGYFDSLAGWQNAYTWGERIRTVTIADIQRVAKRYFNPDNRVIGWVSSTNAPKAPPPKPDAAPEAPPSDPKKPPHSKVDHVHMTGYKDDDYAVGPRRPSVQIAQASGTAAPASGAPANGAGGNPLPSVPANGTGANHVPTIPANGTGGNHVPTVPANGAGEKPQPLSTPALPVLPKLREENLKAVHQKVLSNGLTLVVFESHLSPIVQVMGAVKAGDAFDPAGKKGISAVTAAALNYGSSKRNRPQILSSQEDIGLPPQAMLRFDQGQETIDFQTECLSRDLGTQLSLLGEIFTSPGFQDVDVDKAKQDVISIMRRQQESADYKVSRALLRSLVSASSPYCPGDPVDRLKSINKFEPADLKDFQEHFLNPGSTCIVLAGDVTLNQAAQIAEKAFTGWTGKNNRQFPSIQINNKRVLRTTVPLKDKSQTVLCFGQLVPMPMNHQEYGSLLLADCALTNHPIFSRFGQLVNTEPQMAAAVGSDALESDVESISNAVQWSLTLEPEPNAVPYVVRTVQNELRNFAKNGVNAQEVAEAKRYLAGAIPVHSMSTVPIACKSILDSVLQVGDPECLGRILSSIRNGTAESVNKLIRTTFKPDQASLVVAGSGLSISSVRNQTDKTARVENTEKAEKVDKPDKLQKADKIQKADKSDKTVKSDKSDKTVKSDKSDKTDKSDKSDKAAKADKADKTAKGKKSEKSAKGDKSEKSARK